MSRIALVLTSFILLLTGCGGDSTDSYIFEIVIRNVANPQVFTNANGQPSVVGFGPAVGAVHRGANPFFSVGTAASAELESFAEDADVTELLNVLSANQDVTLSILGVEPIEENSNGGLLLPDDTYRIVFNVEDTSSKLSLLLHYIQANDVFAATVGDGIALFDANGQPMSQTVSMSLQFLDAGTEVNEPPGAGTTQPISQSELNQGATEGGVVRPVDDGFSYPDLAQTLEITITPTAVIN